MTEVELVSLVLEAAGKTERELPRFRILGLVKQGLELLAKRVMAQAGWQGLQKDFVDTPTAGRLDLDQLALQDELLFDPELVEVRVWATHEGITIIDNVRTLEFGGLAKDHVFCAREGNDLVFRSANGTMNTYATKIRIKANQIPTLTGLKAPYNGALVAIMVELATGQAAPAELTGVNV